MAIISCLCTSFKTELLSATHDFDNDTFKIALYGESADLGPQTTAYTTSGECSGSGYTAGGATLTAASPTASGTTALVDFDDVTFSSVTVSARGALIYNSSKSNKAVAVYDFGITRVKTAADLVITFPTPNAQSAVIRIR